MPRAAVVPSGWLPGLLRATAAAGATLALGLLLGWWSAGLPTPDGPRFSIPSRTPPGRSAAIEGQPTTTLSPHRVCNPGAVDGVHDRPAVDRLLEVARRHLPKRPGPADLPALRARGALIVDIRPSELRTRDGLLEGAVVVDRNQLEWRLDPTSPWRLPEVSGPDQEIVLFCDEGYASSLAAATLHLLGLRRATDLDGGFQAVVREGLGGTAVERY